MTSRCKARKLKPSELSGKTVQVPLMQLKSYALNWMVAAALGRLHEIEEIEISTPGYVYLWLSERDYDEYRILWLPSERWEQGGPIMHVERIWSTCSAEGDLWCARKVGNSTHYEGHAPLMAGMCCVVGEAFGPIVSIPEELA